MHLEYFLRALRVFLFANVTATKTQGRGKDALRLTTGKNQGYEVKKKKEVKEINEHQGLSFYEAETHL